MIMILLIGIFLFGYIQLCSSISMGGSNDGNFTLIYTGIGLTQPEAQAQCASFCHNNNNTYRLADVESAADHARIMQYYTCKGMVESWFGIESRNGKDGPWTWIHNNRPAWDVNKLAIWSMWNLAEPNYMITNICARFAIPGLVVARDTFCTNTFTAYICEGDFPDPCEPNPCLHGGTCCVVDFQYLCHCNVNTYGRRCENKKDKTCGPPPVFYNSTLVYDPGDHLVNTVVKYMCQYGYNLTGGSLEKTCSSDGTWFGCDPVCSPITCPTPTPVVDGTLVNYSGNTVLSLIHYICDDGFSLVSGDVIMMCMVGQEWSGTLPVCKSTDCSYPTNVSHIHLSVTSLTYLSNVTYTCADNHTHYSGNLVRYCVGGIWNGTEPVCQEPRCPEPPAVPNAVWRLRTSTFDETLTYICNLGYSMVSGSFNKTCTVDKRWVGEDLVCELDQYYFRIDIAEDLPPTTTREVVMNTIGMLEVDLLVPNLAAGSVIGFALFSSVFWFVIVLDYTRLKTGCFKLRKRCRKYCHTTGQVEIRTQHHNKKLFKTTSRHLAKTLGHM